MATNDVLSLAEGYRAINDPASATAVGGGGSGGHDDELAIWISAVSERLDELCGPVVIRTITDEPYDGTVDGSPTGWHALRHAPGSPTSATTITSVVEYDGTVGTTLTAESNATKPTDGYLFEQHLGTLHRRSGGADALFPAGRGNVIVTYEAGRYANTAAVGSRFKLVAGAILRRLWNREGSAWSTGGDPFEGIAGQPGFFRAMSESVVREFLDDELRII